MPKKTTLSLPHNRGVFYLILIIVGFLILGGSFYLFRQQQQKTNDASQVLIEKVGRLIELPMGEKPSVATVFDVNKLKDESFFKKARNGDKVLIYAKSQLAILYRPSIDKLITVAPVNLGTKKGSPQGSGGTPTPSPRQLSLTIYNGTNEKGLAAASQQKIESQFPQIKVTATGNALDNYAKTSVYDLTGKNKEVASQIAQFLSGEVVATLSASETKPTTDFLVIVVQ